jgi:3-phenylpropionate/trans-cinnamate dioxygenase ferredoxin subunit
MPYVRVCFVDEIDDEDVRRFEHDGKSYAVYHVDRQFYATDGLCTHEHVHLCEGLVQGIIIECPKHNGRFDVRSGKALSAPARIGLRTYPTKVEQGVVYICVD